MKKNINNHTLSLSVVIPTFNNASTLDEQLKKCVTVLNKTKIKYEIIISNDASRDLTEKLLQKYKKIKNFRIYNQKINLGISKNIRFLYSQAKNNLILLYSIDGDWYPQDIERLIACTMRENADIVIGKRIIKDYSFIRKIISFVYNALPYILFQVHTYDTGSIKIFKRALFVNNKFVSKSISFESEMIIKAAKNKKIIKYINVHHKKDVRNSKNNINVKLLIESFFDLIKLRFSNLDTK